MMKVVRFALAVIGMTMGYAGMIMYNACVDNHEKDGLVIIRESVYGDLKGRITKESLQEALKKI